MIKLPDNILVGIPVYNECRHIEEVLTAVHKYSQSVLVINDGSRDETGKILDKFLWVNKITHNVNRGYGQSLIDIFQYAILHQYQWAITMDCDHQHQPACLTRFYDFINENNADIISGSRYLINHSCDGNIPKERLEINRHITGLLNHTLNFDLTDAFCGFKAYRIESMKRVYLQEKGYGLPLELWIQAAKQQLRIHEIAVPLIYHDPTRNFAGNLENPKVRLKYYLDIINFNLNLHGYKSTNTIDCS